MFCGHLSSCFHLLFDQAVNPLKTKAELPVQRSHISPLHTLDTAAVEVQVATGFSLFPVVIIVSPDFSTFFGQFETICTSLSRQKTVVHFITIITYTHTKKMKIKTKSNYAASTLKLISFKQLFVSGLKNKRVAKN